ncbi:50S ribosomal protein L28 [Caldilinea sp.]|jgi:large subunit ribosomal protein L28|uniref:50S ribosomal protein L28 n=1 Tax=Caldilinea sp. TaxID=2293560 RepID=UPI001B2991A9|nr:50S ribosomal protein L28 [Caldilinea sp.]MBO9393012.1 50S ribosomal protein L28 [Caldilinea sp.]
MAKCKVSGKRPQHGNNRPWSRKATQRIWQPNVQQFSVFVPELGKNVRLRVSARSMRSIARIGLKEYLRKQGLTLQDVL